MLPGIKKVQWAPSNELYLVPESESLQTTSKVSDIVQWRDIPITGLASVQEEQTVENNQNIYNVKVEFFSCKKPDFLSGTAVFLLTDLHGNRYLVGSSEKPFPVCESTNDIPDSFTKRRGYEISITYKNTFGLIHLE